MSTIYEPVSAKEIKTHRAPVDRGEDARGGNMTHQQHNESMIAAFAANQSGRSPAYIRDIVRYVRLVSAHLDCTFEAARTEKIEQAVTTVISMRRMSQVYEKCLRTSLRVFYRWLVETQELVFNPFPVPVRKRTKGAQYRTTTLAGCDPREPRQLVKYRGNVYSKLACRALLLAVERNGIMSRADRERAERGLRSKSWFL